MQLFFQVQKLQDNSGHQGLPKGRSKESEGIKGHVHLLREKDRPGPRKRRRREISTTSTATDENQTEPVTGKGQRNPIERMGIGLWSTEFALKISGRKLLWRSLTRSGPRALRTWVNYSGAGCHIQ